MRTRRGGNRSVQYEGVYNIVITSNARLRAQRLRAKVEMIRAAEGLTFVQAWNALRKREPGLFTVEAHRGDDVVVCQGGFATRL